MAGTIARGSIHLCPFPAPDKARPVVVLTADRSLGRLTTVTVAPITSSIRHVPSQVLLTEDDGMKSPCAVNLHQVTTVDRQKIGNWVAQLSEERMRQICAAMNFALGCDLE